MTGPRWDEGPGDPREGAERHEDMQAAFAATFVDELVRNRVTHAVVCPGSRSTPVAVALADHPGVAVHVRLDERSAGFTALGIGLATGVPALVLTTSGTAAAELHASVVEADLARVPLLVLTADRPPELQDVGAPQTIDQTRLFGPSVRWFHDPGVPSSAQADQWRSTACRSVAKATAGPQGPGPVHLNLPFREPLLGDASAAGGPRPGRSDGGPWHRVVGVAAGHCGDPLDPFRSTDSTRPGGRGLIVAGSGCGDPEAVMALARLLRWPVLADPRSGLRGTEAGMIGAADGVLRSGRFSAGHLPDVVVRMGDPWVSKVVNGFLAGAARGGAEMIAIDPDGRWRDPERMVTAFVASDPTDWCRSAAARLSDSGRPGAGSGPGAGAPVGDRWWDDWVRADRAAWSAVRSAMAGPTLDEPSLACRLTACLPDGVTLVVSSSMPVRDVEAFAPPRERPLRVVSNRGANGIDGVVSTAIGVALGSGRPTVALVGDLAFLHDVSALVGASSLAVPLTVVVADNGGGGIFSFLDPAEALGPDMFEAIFGTPQACDVAAVAAGFGWPVDDIAAEAAPGLEELLLGRLGSPTCSLVRVRLPGRTENVAIHGEINSAIVRAVDAL